jgi:ubiquinone/menaquinone biosynthesis C-methylase UbiE
MSEGSGGADRYYHGYGDAETRRLLSQSELLRDLIVEGLDYRAGDSCLEIACATGATLAVLAESFPGIRLAGVDAEPSQVERARAHLRSRGLGHADLRVGDARALPFDDGRFDHVYVMWLFEHLRSGALDVLREAHRVLRSGGTIALTEPDYATFKVFPLSADWDYVEAAQYALFERNGSPVVGRELGTLLLRAGFVDVRSTALGRHFFSGQPGRALERYVDYWLGFLEPGLLRMAAIGFDEERLRRGLAHLRSLPTRTDGSVTQVIYRAHARRP